MLWNTQTTNEGAEEDNHFHTLERDVDITSAAWISENQIAVGLKNGLIEIYEIGDREKKTQNRFLKHAESEQVGQKLIICERKTTSYTDFVRFSIVISMKNWRISGLEWNERTQYLASCSLEGWIKVILLIPYISLTTRRDQTDDGICAFTASLHPFRLTDLVGGQR